MVQISRILQTNQREPALADSRTTEVNAASSGIQQAFDASNTVEGESRFRTVFVNQEGFDEFRKFLTNVFMQCDEDKFETLMRDILDNPELDTDEKIYEVLSERISEAKKSIGGVKSCGLGTIASLLAALRALGRLKGDLAEQVKRVMGNIEKIDGYLEIGYPGRMIRPIMGKLKVNGPIIVVNDGEDLAQRGFPFTRPYNKVVPLADYEPISEETAADSSLDMVSCFIGLHHRSNEDGALDRFVDSIHRVLRPGGTFILMDHDAKTKELQDLCWVVHGVFNAATGEAPQTDREEYRSFQSMEYWKNYLEGRGFELVTEEADFQIREGDPTMNTVVRFRKKPEGLQNVKDALDRTPGYAREQWKTFSSIPEWYNVGYSKAYGEFLQGNDMNRFSFMKHVTEYWKVFGNSWNMAREHSGFWELMGSDFIAMDLFIGVTMTLECLYRSLASTPLALFNGKSRQGATNLLKQAIAGDAKEYAEFINHTPFYSYPYFGQVVEFWTQLVQQQTHGTFKFWKWEKLLSKESLGNFYLTLVMSLEYLAKGAVSAPIAWVYGSGSFKEADRIGMLIDVSSMESLPEGCEEIESFSTDQLMHVENPRYLPNTRLMVELSQSGAKFVNISGQEWIAVKLFVEKGATMDVIDGCESRFTYPDPTNPDRDVVVLKVPVDNLNETLAKVMENGLAVEQVHVHDF